MAKHSADDDEGAMISHQQDMLRKFRLVNFDYLLVGFYQAEPFGACFTESFVESVFDYQSTCEDSIVLVYDPIKTANGVLSIKAYRLSPEAMKLCYKDFSPESIKRAGLTYENLFQELPVSIKNSLLVNIMLCELAIGAHRDHHRAERHKGQHLDLGSGGGMEKSLRQLMVHVDSLNSETSRYNKYMGAKQRQETLKENYLQKRQLENDSRRARGDPPLPDEDINKLFKQVTPPTMLDSLLAASEINAHVSHTVQMSVQNLSKVFMAEAILADKSGGRTDTAISGGPL